MKIENYIFEKERLEFAEGKRSKTMQKGLVLEWASQT
jgi:hypothetical protein